MRSRVIGDRLPNVLVVLPEKEIRDIHLIIVLGPVASGSFLRGLGLGSGPGAFSIACILCFLPRTRGVSGYFRCRCVVVQSKAISPANRISSDVCVGIYTT